MKIIGLRYILPFLLAGFILAMCVSCSRKPVRFSDFAEIPVSGWAYGDTLAFLSGFPDSVVSGNLRVAVDYASDYLYSNLWLEISYNNRLNGEMTLVRDTVELSLCDSVGNRIGNGVASNFQIEMPVNHIMGLDTRRTVGVRHIMRTDTLHGINRIGLFFNEEETNEE